MRLFQFAYLVLGLFCIQYASPITAPKKLLPHFVILVPSYNNSEWYKKNLESIFTQTYPHYRVIYIDDCSPDGTGQLVHDHVIQNNWHEKTSVIINTNRKGALANLYYGIHSAQDNEIIVTLDGDDWFAHEQVLEILAEVYRDPNVWLTYGQYSHPWGGIGCPRAINQDVVERNAYRETASVASHLRTFYAGLFKKIKLKDLLYEGTFFPMTWDWAMMYPMLEMSRGKFRFISEVLYIYNTDNPINDSKVDGSFQEHLGKIIQKKEPYKPIETPMLSEKLHIPSVYTLILIDNDRNTSSLEHVLQELQKQNYENRIYVLHKKNHLHQKTTNPLMQTVCNVHFIAYNDDINTPLQEIFITERKRSGAQFGVVTPCSHALTINQHIPRALTLLNQTMATICSVVTLAKVEKQTRHNITETHYTPLYDDAYTFQLAWNPLLPITTHHGHIFSLNDIGLHDTLKLITNHNALTPQFKNTFSQHAGLLLINS